MTCSCTHDARILVGMLASIQTGRGKLVYSDKSEYEGDWEFDMAHGWGTHSYANGDVFRGGYFRGKRHGRGTYFFADGRVKAVGYVSGVEVGGGVLWSAEKTRAWRLGDGNVVEEVPLGEAETLAASI